MLLNNYGVIIKRQWEWLAKKYDYITIDEYCVMPDHFHGIIYINGGDDRLRTGHGDVRNGRDRSLQKIKPLPQLIGAFKTTSSKHIHQLGLVSFCWQKSYHDRIIRNETTLHQIRQYIINNPVIEL